MRELIWGWETPPSAVSHTLSSYEDVTVFISLPLTINVALNKSWLKLFDLIEQLFMQILNKWNKNKTIVYCQRFYSFLILPHSHTSTNAADQNLVSLVYCGSAEVANKEKCTYSRWASRSPRCSAPPCCCSGNCACSPTDHRGGDLTAPSSPPSGSSCQFPVGSKREIEREKWGCLERPGLTVSKWTHTWANSGCLSGMDTCVDR